MKKNLKLINQRFSREITELSRGSFFAGQVALDARAVQGVGFGKVKGWCSPYDWVTDGDLRSQQRYLQHLIAQFPYSKFLAEEDEGMNQFTSVLLQQDSLEELYQLRHCWIIDPVDGTEEFYIGCAEWAVSGAWMSEGYLRGGAVYIPDINGGILCVGEIGKGMIFFEHGSSTPCEGKIRPVDSLWLDYLGTALPGKNHPDHARLKFPFIRHGVSLTIEPAYASFLYRFAERAAPKSIVSCAVGLAYVAMGKIQAFVHRPLPWYDLAGGVALIEAAIQTDGRRLDAKVQYYQITQKGIELLSKPNLFGETGVIAGSLPVVDWLTDLLVELYST